MTKQENRIGIGTNIRIPHKFLFYELIDRLRRRFSGNPLLEDYFTSLTHTRGFIESFLNQGGIIDSKGSIINDPVDLSALSDTAHHILTNQGYYIVRKMNARRIGIPVGGDEDHRYFVLINPNFREQVKDKAKIPKVVRNALSAYIKNQNPRSKQVIHIKPQSLLTTILNEIYSIPRSWDR